MARHRDEHRGDRHPRGRPRRRRSAALTALGGRQRDPAHRSRRRAGVPTSTSSPRSPRSPRALSLEHVESAIAARLVDEVAGAPGRMTFSHALVQSTLVDELSTTRRVRIHGTIGTALERAATLRPLSSPITSRKQRRLVWPTRRSSTPAGRPRRPTLGWHTTRSCTSTTSRSESLDAADTSDRAARAQLLIDRGYAHHSRGDSDAGRADAVAAADLGRALGLPHLVGLAGVAYQGLVGHWAAPHDPVAVDLMREGLEALGPDDDATRACDRRTRQRPRSRAGRRGPRARRARRDARSRRRRRSSAVPRARGMGMGAALPRSVR